MPRGGFSLVEIVVSAVIVGVLLVAAMRTVAMSIFTQYKTAEQVIAWSLADGLLAEILAKQYQEPGTTPQFGPDPGESATSKIAYDDVDDFHNWCESPPQYADGTGMPDLTGWTRRVSVAWVNPNDPNQTALSETGAKRITVSVEHNGSVVATRFALRTSAP